MDAVDSYIEEPVRQTDLPFLMPVEDVFSITGRGTVATGRIERGIVHVGDTIEIVGMKPEIESTVVTGVEMFRKLLDEGRAGDNVGCLLRGVKREDIERGQVLAQPKSITPHTKFVASVYVLSKDEGGRHTPFFGGYRPQFYFRTTDVTGVCTLESGCRDDHAGRQRRDGDRADSADRHGRGSALRHPRGWAYRGRRASSARFFSSKIAQVIPRPAPSTGQGGVFFPLEGRRVQQNKIRIRLKAYDHEQIDRSASQIVETAQRSGATISGPVPLPTECNRYCVIKGPFKDKDSREHFEIRTHKRLIDIYSPTPEDGRLADASRPSGRCRHRDQGVRPD